MPKSAESLRRARVPGAVCLSIYIPPPLRLLEGIDDQDKLSFDLMVTLSQEHLDAVNNSAPVVVAHCRQRSCVPARIGHIRRNPACTLKNRGGTNTLAVRDLGIMIACPSTMETVTQYRK